MSRCAAITISSCGSSPTLCKLLRRLADGGASSQAIAHDVRDRLDQVARRLERHNRLEETAIYPLQAEILTPAERQSLSRSIRRELENLPAGFAILRTRRRITESQRISFAHFPATFRGRPAALKVFGKSRLLKL